MLEALVGIDACGYHVVSKAERNHLRTTEDGALEEDAVEINV